MDLAKRGYKLQEFVAHTGGVNCLSLGKKSCRLFVTGGDDQRVNLWSIGKSTSLNSFKGHTSGVDSVAFDKPEVLVLSGASNGVIKLWDLEETKLVRSFSGHVSNCTAVEYHPFGEFFASGSVDTNVKIWDIRKKESIHTYEGHTKGISTIRFTPDGRWVVSGGLDNAVKIWDLTAGKLLHDFKYHVGHITSLDFHPLEFLLATGSADKTVKFWDLETFELIGTSRPEATGVRATAFHPDGRTIFCGLNDSLKVYSWEPIICHDTVDLGWSTLADLCIRDDKLLGCSYYENSVGIWISDISLIGPYEGTSVPKPRDSLLKESSLTRIGSHISSQNLRSISPDDDAKEIKTIYVDTSGEKPFNLRRSVSSNSLKAEKSSESKEINSKSTTQKRPPSINVNAKAIGQSLSKSYLSPTVVSRDSQQNKDLAKSRRESIAKGNADISPKPNLHVRSRSTVTSKLDVEKLSKAVDYLSFDYLKSDISSPNVGDSRETTKGKLLSGINVADKLAKVSSPSSQSSRVESADSSKVTKPVKYVNGVAVVEGRTRSLVERFEKRETVTIDEAQGPDITPQVTQKPDEASSLIPVKGIQTPVTEPESRTRFQNVHMPIIESESMSRSQSIHMPVTEPESTTGFQNVHTPIIEPESMARFQSFHNPIEESEPTVRFQNVRKPIKEPESTTRFQNLHTPVIEPESTTRFQSVHKPIEDPGSTARFQSVHKPIKEPEPTARFQSVHTPVIELESTTRFQSVHEPIEDPESTARFQSVRKPIKEPESTTRFQSVRKPIKESESTATSQNVRKTIKEPEKTARFQNVRRPIIEPESTARFQRVHKSIKESVPTARFQNVRKPIIEPESTARFQNVQTPIIEPESTAGNEDVIADDLMQNHDLILSTLHSRLSKLQVVRQFWERNDIRGGINAMQTLPDHSVQADVVSVLVEKLNIITLDLFSCLLPILLRLLESKIERHVTVSLELLLKLVAVFGPSIQSTVSAPPPIGVDLHAEERIECCKKCSILLQDLQKMLPTLARRGGSVTKCSLELNLVLTQL